jgi:hypothetical protein
VGFGLEGIHDSSTDPSSAHNTLKKRRKLLPEGAEETGEESEDHLASSSYSLDNAGAPTEAFNVLGQESADHEFAGFKPFMIENEMADTATEDQDGGISSRASVRHSSSAMPTLRPTAPGQLSSSIFAAFQRTASEESKPGPTKPEPAAGEPPAFPKRSLSNTAPSAPAEVVESEYNSLPPQFSRAGSSGAAPSLPSRGLPAPAPEPAAESKPAERKPAALPASSSSSASQLPLPAPAAAALPMLPGQMMALSDGAADKQKRESRLAKADLFTSSAEPARDEMKPPLEWLFSECVVWLKFHGFNEFVDTFYNNGFEGRHLVALQVESFAGMKSHPPARCKQLIDAIRQLKRAGGWKAPAEDEPPAQGGEESFGFDSLPPVSPPSLPSSARPALAARSASGSAVASPPDLGAKKSSVSSLGGAGASSATLMRGRTNSTSSGSGSRLPDTSEVESARMKHFLAQNMSREDCFRLLQNGDDGEYIMRKSQTAPGMSRTHMHRTSCVHSHTHTHTHTHTHSYSITLTNTLHVCRAGSFVLSTISGGKVHFLPIQFRDFDQMYATNAGQKFPSLDVSCVCVCVCVCGCVCGCL